MCGRFVIARAAEELIDELGIGQWEDREQYVPRFNLAPTQAAPVLRGPERVLAMMRWGLVPSWAQDVRIGPRMINARAETLREKPAFRSLVGPRRAVVPAEGYYEWQRRGRAKQPFYIHAPDDRLLMLAGLWDSWQAPDDAALRSFTIVTVAPSEAVRAIHHRMPAILDDAGVAAWLDVGAVPAADASRHLTPFNTLTCRPVGTLVNSPRNDTPACREPLSEPLAAGVQPELW